LARPVGLEGMWREADQGYLKDLEERGLFAEYGTQPEGVATGDRVAVPERGLWETAVDTLRGGGLPHKAEQLMGTLPPPACTPRPS